MLNPYEVLANGIITQAANDYRQAAKFLKKHPRTDKLEATVAAKLPKRKSGGMNGQNSNFPRNGKNGARKNGSLTIFGAMS